MAVTIKDVAKLAGVATSTVSRTLKDQPNISEATKNKVRKAMAELGYVPNVAAQNLANQSTQTIGLILPPNFHQNRIQHPFFMDVVSEISQSLNQDQYTASIVCDKDFESLSELVKQMHQQRRVDGFIVLYSVENDPVTRYLLEEDIPFVMLGMPDIDDNQIRYVDNDNVSVGRTATRFLLERGHRRFAFVGRSQKELVYQERYNGYLLEMQRNSLDYQGFFNIDEAECLDELIQYLETENPTALFVGDDVLAIKLLPWLAQYGYRVGDNFSLMSVNNSVFSTLFHPYLTTVDIHVKELSVQSAQLMVQLLKDQTLPLTKYIIPHEVIVRETVMRI